MPSPVREIWSETVALADLCSAPALSLLRRFKLRPLIAVQPRQLPAVTEVGARLSGEGVEFGLWPMLDDGAGRWASVVNMLDYLAFCDEVLEHAAATPPSTLAIDLEPSIEWVRALIGGPLPRLGQGSGSSFGAAKSALISYVASIHARGIRTLAAAVPLVLHDPPGTTGWQRLLGTPVADVGFERICVMAYPSLLEGWSRGLLARAHARQLLGFWAERAHQRGWGIALGAVGLGALGNEPRYRSAAELAEDVAQVRAIGVESLSLLDLGGVLGRPPPEAWLEAFTQTAAGSSAPPLSRRVGSVIAALDLGGRVLG